MGSDGIGRSTQRPYNTVVGALLAAPNLVVLTAALLLAGCHNTSSPDAASAPPPLTLNADRSAGAFAQTDPWLLTTTDPNANRGNNGIFLGNGAVGSTVNASANMTFQFRAGHYDAAENLIRIRVPVPPVPNIDTHAAGYSQTLDMRHGVLSTKSGSAVTSLSMPQSTDWQKLWQTADITIDGDPEAQQLVHKLMFDLLQSTRPGASDSIPPESLSGDFYKGHIFWDAEIWMFPALLAQRPDYAKSILDYRFKHLPQAREIAKAEGCKGASFPWESAASGKEVAPGGFSRERHITADVGWAFYQYWLATQDKAWLKSQGWPMLSAVADYWATKAKKDPKDGKYHIKGVVGPDELNTSGIDDNTYTNAMARYCLLAAGEAAKIVGQPADPAWATVAKNLALPFANGHYLQRANDDGKATKQADGELVIYPAGLPMDRKTEEATYDFNAKRPIKNGPAMTASIHALIEARLGRQADAEKSFRDSYRPFMRGPFLLFSEKRSMDRCVFTTGAGGVLQSVLYGFGGLDFGDWDNITKRPVTLPPTWKKLTITGIQRAGKRYTLTVTPQGRTLTEQ